ncbi:MAG TPA: SDR family NAD(P)-dependent oxidoreductase [Acidobacteriaceae bacterium]|jgi:NAD(P)-dependent dehydrogenase (short-subunit alcohol dehydrogenase family)
MKAEKLFDISGHVAVVTGAASGIGFAICEVLAANGALVVLVDVNPDSLNAAAENLRSADAECETELLDVGRPDMVMKAFDRIVSRYGRIDCVFANAGVSGGAGYERPEGLIDTAKLDLWDNCLRVNLSGAFNTMRAAAKHMKAQRGGSIVVTSSVAALRASGFPSYGYSASKAGISQAVRVASIELGPYNVRMNAIAPGPFPTNIGNGRMHSPEIAAALAVTIPLGRMAELDEIKGLALLLASPASSYMTGAIIPVDGGTQA